MADEVCVDPVQLARAARLALDESQELSTAVATFRSAAALDEGAFGNENFGFGGPHNGYNLNYIDSMEALEQFVVVLEETADGLYQTAFTCAATDQDAADSYGDPERPGTIPV